MRLARRQVARVKQRPAAQRIVWTPDTACMVVLDWFAPIWKATLLLDVLPVDLHSMSCSSSCKSPLLPAPCGDSQSLNKSLMSAQRSLPDMSNKCRLLAKSRPVTGRLRSWSQY